MSRAGAELAAGAGGPEAYPTASRPCAAAEAEALQASAVGTSALVLVLAAAAGGKHGTQRASSIALVASGASGPPLALHASLPCPAPAPSEPRQASSCARLSSLRVDA